MVIWIVGLSSCGKSTLAMALKERLELLGKSVFVLDGDDIRDVFGESNGGSNYTIEARKSASLRLVRLCKLVESQGFIAMCPTLGVFEDVLSNNRKIFNRYFQILLHAPMSTLKERDTKGIYLQRNESDKNLFGEVVGVDIPYSFPSNSDLEFDTSKNCVDYIADDVMASLLEKLEI